ncbi:UrcA family protein [Brevundimonas sp.]|uniref:UrcA family protein n=1 Tax=Brevundimonas sp. TaxID=1871086 RepID=UPI0035B1F538
MSLSLVVAAALSITAAGSPVSKGDYSIDIRGIDFATPSGADEFDARVSRAARRACSSGYVGVRRVTCLQQFRIEAAASLKGEPRDSYLASRPQYVAALADREL